MSYRVTRLRDAQKALDKMSADLRGRRVLAMRLPADNPRHPGVVNPAGPDSFHRDRVGESRMDYAIRDHEHVVIVMCTGHRREVYR